MFITTSNFQTYVRSRRGGHQLITWAPDIALCQELKRPNNNGPTCRGSHPGYLAWAPLLRPHPRATPHVFPPNGHNRVRAGLSTWPNPPPVPPFKRLPKLPFQVPPISTPKVVVAHLPSFLKCTTWLIDSVYPAPCKTNIELRVSRWIYCLVKENTFTGKIDQSSSLGLLSLTLPRTIYDIASFVLTSNMFQPPHVGAVKILWVQSFLSFQNLLALGRKIVLWVWWLNPRRIWAEAAARFFVHIYIYILYSLSLDK